MIKTITFDFDNTIAMSHMDIESDEVKYIFDEYNFPIIDLIKKYIGDGHDIHIVTSRFENKEGMFPDDTVEIHLEKLALKGYFWPDRVHYTNGAEKRQKLKELGSTLHYDDDMEEHISNFGKIVVKNPYNYYKDTEFVSKAIIFDTDDKILILKRTDEGQAWDIPGGHLKDIEVKRGEIGYESGLEREVAEETGLILPFSKRIDTFSFTWKGETTKISFFLSKFDLPEPLVNLNIQDRMENSEYRWVSLDEIDKFAANGTQVMRKGVDFAKSHGLINEEERFQKVVKRKHSRMKKRLIGLGKNKHFGGGKGHTRPKYGRAKSAPPIGEAKGEKKKMISVKIKKNTNKNDILREKLDEIISSEFDLSKLQLKTKLNGKFWLNKRLKQDIREKLLEIAEDFSKDTEIEGKIEDITLTGSLASYNYHSKSDIDLHLLVDFTKIDKNGEIIKELMNLLRIKWNEAHKIVINGHEVEIYVQDSSEKHYSAGVYSISDDKWLVIPSPKAEKFDYDAIIDKTRAISKEIDTIQAEYDQKNYKKANKMAEKLSEKIRKLRSSGLEDDGIYSIENLAFKLLRNSGKMANLMNLRSGSYDKSLSLGDISSIKVRIINKLG